MSGPVPQVVPSCRVFAPFPDAKRLQPRKRGTSGKFDSTMVHHRTGPRFRLRFLLCCPGQKRFLLVRKGKNDDEPTDP